MTRPRVLVLKERNASSDSDPYEAALVAAGYDCEFLPVLAHRLVNLDNIAEIVSTGHVANPSQQDAGLARVSGVIFTSQRAVEAWAEGGRRATAAGRQSAQDWSTTPFYAVGPATASAIARLDANVRPHTTCVLGGGESGSADKLAQYIVAQHLSPDKSSSVLHSMHPYPELTNVRERKPLMLYLVGDKRRDLLPLVLQRSHVDVAEVQAYETFQAPSVADNYLELAGASSSSNFDWIVFFSPSGAKLLLPLLATRSPSWPRFAAIGPTTRDWLLSQEGVDVHAMAEVPTPESLVNAILRASGT